MHKMFSFIFFCPFLFLIMLFPIVTMAECPGVEDYAPIKTEEPVYPKRAYKRGIQGYAIVGFTITTEGGIKDVKVIESKPKGIFDRSAIKTIKQFRYDPCIVEDQAIELTDNKLKFTFALTD